MPLKLLFFILWGFLTPGMGKVRNVNHTIFEDVQKWKYLEFQYDSQARKEKVMNESNYEKSAGILLDFDKAKDGRIFVALGRKKGIPASLNTVSEKKVSGGPLLKPYPDWNWYSRKDCVGIHKVVKIQIDDCNRLWVLDSGYKKKDGTLCNPQLLMFNLKSDKLESRMMIGKEFFQDRDGKGYLGNIVVQTEGWGCRDTKVYMSYLSGSGLVVWNGKYLWRLNGPDSKNLKGEIEIENDKIDIESGIFGLALSPKIGKEPQILAMRSLATRNMFTVKIDDILATAPSEKGTLMNLFDAINIFKSKKPESTEIHDNAKIEYKLHKNVLPTPSAAQSFNEKGVLFMGLIKTTAIACWNKMKNLTTDNIDILDEDKDKLQFVSGAKIISSSKTGGEEELWILTNRFPQYYHKSLNFEEFNYRIMKQKTKRLITNSKCIN